ncbi:MAG: hypothetical protein L0Z53_08285 [Acidobacteriales bacterium]|nr:hypothetical protein [Terriglobales bacterium]
MRRYWVAAVIAGVLAGPMSRAQTDSTSASSNNLPVLPQTDYRPKFPGDPARSDVEAIALGYMRTVVDAQRQYKKKKMKYAGSLQALVGSGSFTKRMLRTDRGAYTATFTGNSKGTKYSLQMIPKQFDATHRAFFVNESGTIRAEAEQPATQESAVLRADR